MQFIYLRLRSYVDMFAVWYAECFHVSKWHRPTHTRSIIASFHKLLQYRAPYVSQKSGILFIITVTYTNFVYTAN